MSISSRLYAAAPVWAQNAAVSLYGLGWYWKRFGPGYRRAVREYEARATLDTGDWARWTERALARVLQVAADHVPYYREHWSAPTRAAARAGDLQTLPLLDKRPLRKTPWAFVRDDVSVRRPLEFQTSGSTGTPITSIWTAQELRKAMAVREVRSLAWAGVSFRQPRATFSGRLVVPKAETGPPYWRFNTVERQLYFSAFHLSPDTAKEYVRALWHYRPRWLTGYAVSYYLLARQILEQDLQLPPLEAVVTTSEKVTPAMRAIIEDAYGCPAFEEYGTVEHALLATECPEGRLHVSPDVSVVEILDESGAPCPPGTPGEVVVTTLARRYQPLIRFRIGDVAAWARAPCPCGRSLPVLEEIVGRIEDVVVGPDGRELVRFHGIFVGQPNIVEGQVVQEAPTRFSVRIVPGPRFGAEDEADVVLRMRQRLGATVEISVHRVEKIPRDHSGKFRAVIQAMNAGGS